MPLWLIVALGAGIIWLASRPSTTSVVSATPLAASFYAGQTVTIAPLSQMYSDAALTQSAGEWPGGTGTIKVVDTINNSIGFVGPSGQGLGGGAPAYVASSAVSA
jgi:hypothetical protein